MNRSLILVAMGALMLLGSSCLKVHAGHYANIVIDDLYADWAGVPVLDSDGGDNDGGPDIGDTQIANDGNFLYIRNTFTNSLQLSTYIALDVDLDSSTGYDVFGLGIFGSEAGWQNDFGFSQGPGFNTGALTGEFFGGGHALLAPFGNFSQRELAISLSNMTAGGLALFPGDTIRLMLYSDTGTGADGIPAGFPGDSGVNGDITAIFEYTLAVPEPTGLLLLTTACIGVFARRQRMF